MPGTTSTALPSFSHDQHHETDATKRKGVFLGGQPRPIPRGGTPASANFWDLLCVQTIRETGTEFFTVINLMRGKFLRGWSWMLTRDLFVAANLLVFYSELFDTFVSSNEKLEWHNVKKMKKWQDDLFLASSLHVLYLNFKQVSKEILTTFFGRKRRFCFCTKSSNRQKHQRTIT